MKKWLSIGCGGLLILCIVVSALGSLAGDKEAKSETTSAAKATATPKPQPSPKPTSTPKPDTPTPVPVDLTGAGAAVKEMLDTTNAAVGQKFFINYAIKQDRNRLEITVADSWYVFPAFQKERIVETLGNNYALIAAQHGLRGNKPSESNYPTTSLVDAFGKEVAYQSTWQTKVLR